MHRAKEILLNIIAYGWYPLWLVGGCVAAMAGGYRGHSMGKAKRKFGTKKDCASLQRNIGIYKKAGVSTEDSIAHALADLFPGVEIVFTDKPGPGAKVIRRFKPPTA